MSDCCLCKLPWLSDLIVQHVNDPSLEDFRRNSHTYIIGILGGTDVRNFGYYEYSAIG